MPHLVLLISPEGPDSPLAVRIRQALPSTLPLAMQVAPQWQPAPDARGWLLALVDGQGGDPGCPPPSPPPALWLGRAPNPARLPPGLAPQDFCDFLDRGWPASKLAFVLHQHLAAAYLRRMRGLRCVAARRDPGELQCSINNVLTGLLGNAELAVGAARRLPPPVQRRLQCIAELSAELRELMAEAEQTTAAARSAPALPAAARKCA